jgi:hypothetical protein
MRFAILVLTLVSAPQPAKPTAQPSPAVAKAPSPKELEIRKLLELTGQSQLGNQVLGQLMEGFKQAFPKVPEQIWNDFKASVKLDDMTAMLVPLYDKHFSEDEIRELNAFYLTPLGQKLLKELPAVTQDSMNAGQDWGTRLGDTLMKQLEAKGYRLRVPN